MGLLYEASSLDPRCCFRRTAGRAKIRASLRPRLHRAELLPLLLSSPKSEARETPRTPARRAAASHCGKRMKSQRLCRSARFSIPSARIHPPKRREDVTYKGISAETTRICDSRNWPTRCSTRKRTARERARASSGDSHSKRPCCVAGTCQPGQEAR